MHRCRLDNGAKVDWRDRFQDNITVSIVSRTELDDRLSNLRESNFFSVRKRHGERLDSITHSSVSEI